MTEFSATDAALEGFRVTREHSRDVLFWGGVEFVVSMAMVTLMLSVAGPEIHQVMQLGAAGGHPDPNQVLGLIGRLAPVILATVPISIGVQTVFSCAIYRAVLTPGARGRLFNLDLGVGEWKAFLANLLAGGAIFLAYMLGVVAAALISTVAGAVGGGWLGGLFAFLSLLAVAAGLIYLVLRLSLVSVIAFVTHHVALKPSIAMTKGRVATLLGVFVMALFLALLVYILGTVINMALQGVTAAAWKPASDILRSTDVSLAALYNPIVLASTLFTSLFQILARVIMTAPGAHIYQALKGRGVVV